MVTKKDGSQEEFNVEKIEAALKKAFLATGFYKDNKELRKTVERLASYVSPTATSVEDIQNGVETVLMYEKYFDVAKAYIIHRAKHEEAREFTKGRIAYMNKYSSSTDNASTSSETDPNANVTQKNVANLEGEVYKSNNRIIQRQIMKDKLNQLYPEVAKQYEKDLDHHIIYTHDEASTPTLKQYCMAVSLYPLHTEGVGNIDGVTPKEPVHLSSFGGQLGNLAFLLSSQCKGAVAFGEYFVMLNYYIIAEFGKLWYEKLDCITTTAHCRYVKTIRKEIEDAFDQFVWTINQPAGNRSYQSPFTNISYYDHTYFDSLFKDFYYKDGTQPEWAAINCLQKMFMKWFNKLRLKQIVAFPVNLKSAA